MKKFLSLSLIFSAVISTTLYAQSPASTTTTAVAQTPDDAKMLQQAKEKQKPMLIEKTGLTDAQAERVIEINFEIRQAARSLGDLPEAERTAKKAEFKALKEKKYSEIPLTPEQIKSVYTYYEEMAKNKQK